MQIDFMCTGGFANLRLSYRADTEDLPSKIAAELEQLVYDAGVLDTQPEELQSSAPTFPDVFVYRLSVNRGKKRQSLSFNDMTAPDSFQPLLAFLRELALQEKR
jgi:hypothetical protein